MSPEHFVTLGAGFDITESIGSLGEVFALIQEEVTPYADTGLTYLIMPRLQLDVYEGLAMNGSRDPWLGTGAVALF